MSSMLSCTPVLVSTKVRFEGGRTVDREPCPDERHEQWQTYVERMDAQVVVYYLANAGGLSAQYIDDRWVTDCDPVFDAALEDEIAEDVEVLAARGATVVLATSPKVAIWSSTAGEEVACRNETYRRVAAARPGTLVIDLHGFMAGLEPPPGETRFRDFVHLSHWAADEVAAWMLPAVEQALAEAGTPN
jgi:hypothetical protein